MKIVKSYESFKSSRYTNDKLSIYYYIQGHTYRGEKVEQPKGVFYLALASAYMSTDSRVSFEKDLKKAISFAVTSDVCIDLEPIFEEMAISPKAKDFTPLLGKEPISDFTIFNLENGKLLEYNAIHWLIRAGRHYQAKNALDEYRAVLSNIAIVINGMMTAHHQFQLDPELAKTYLAMLQKDFSCSYIDYLFGEYYFTESEGIPAIDEALQCYEKALLVHDESLDFVLITERLLTIVGDEKSEENSKAFAFYLLGLLYEEIHFGIISYNRNISTPRKDSLDCYRQAGALGYATNDATTASKTRAEILFNFGQKLAEEKKYDKAFECYQAAQAYSFESALAYADACKKGFNGTKDAIEAGNTYLRILLSQDLSNNKFREVFDLFTKLPPKAQSACSAELVEAAKQRSEAITLAEQKEAKIQRVRQAEEEERRRIAKEKQTFKDKFKADSVPGAIVVLERDIAHCVNSSSLTTLSSRASALLQLTREATEQTQINQLIKQINQTQIVLKKKESVRSFFPEFDTIAAVKTHYLSVLNSDYLELLEEAIRQLDQLCNCLPEAYHLYELSKDLTSDDKQEIRAKLAIGQLKLLFLTATCDALSRADRNAAENELEKRTPNNPYAQYFYGLMKEKHGGIHWRDQSKPLTRFKWALEQTTDHELVEKLVPKITQYSKENYVEAVCYYFQFTHFPKCRTEILDLIKKIHDDKKGKAKERKLALNAENFNMSFMQAILLNNEERLAELFPFDEQLFINEVNTLLTKLTSFDDARANQFKEDCAQVLAPIINHHIDILQQTQQGAHYTPTGEEKESKLLNDLRTLSQALQSKSTIKISQGQGASSSQSNLYPVIDENGVVHSSQSPLAQGAATKTPGQPTTSVEKFKLFHQAYARGTPLVRQGITYQTLEKTQQFAEELEKDKKRRLSF